MIGHNIGVWENVGLIFQPKMENSWWYSHAMAPTAILLNPDTVRIYLGCWDEEKISRIGFIDVSAKKPSNILGISKRCVLDTGSNGCFDDNGVFPGHAYIHNSKIYLYYTGFQKLSKIPFSNFCGLAISHDGGENFSRVSKAPVMDRSDEGLFTRAGNSVLYENGEFVCCYASGSDWCYISGKSRPVYEVRITKSRDGINFNKVGRVIIPVDRKNEHGLGRPQLTKIGNAYYVFYTRRTLDFSKYHMGVAYSYDLNSWTRIDGWLSTIPHYGFASEMVYFPSFIDTKWGKYLFYVGNGFGSGGLGYAKLT